MSKNNNPMSTTRETEKNRAATDHLELRLGPPASKNDHPRYNYNLSWPAAAANNNRDDEVMMSNLGDINSSVNGNGNKRGFQETNNHQADDHQRSRLIRAQQQQHTERKACCAYSGTANQNGSATTVTDVPNIAKSYKRDGPAVTPAVIGWPPIRSSRKNIIITAAHTNSNCFTKPPAPSLPTGGRVVLHPSKYSGSETKGSQLMSKDTKKDTSANRILAGEEKMTADANMIKNKSNNITNRCNNIVVEKKHHEQDYEELFVKINMDGIPIGRKVNLKAYDNYNTLSSAVDQLFRGLLTAAAAQRDDKSSAVLGTRKGHHDQAEDTAKAIFSGLLDGKGEYTLVYEDNEGDRVLVGDVPWKMFISTVKRLRVLKSSNLSADNMRGRSDQQKGY